LRKLTGFDAGHEAIQKLAVIVTYALAINIFLILAEVFTAFYSEIPAHEEPFEYLFVGLNGDYRLVPWMWLSVLLSWVALALLLVPKWRANIPLLAAACAAIFVSIWLDKGLGLIVGGMVPSPLGAVTRYVPTLSESTIVLGIWACGALMITVFYKITFSVWKEN
jgi:molybdopterin-containing oxidoreductase family membrane subunit